MSRSELSDLEKVLKSLEFITSVRSFDDVLSIFGLDNLPTAQKYGIIFGIITFTVTVSAVLALLVMGGSFKRIAEQAKTGGVSMPDAIEERVTRPLLLERLLEAQEFLLKKYPAVQKTEGMTPLMKMLVNIAPDVAKAQEMTANFMVKNESDKKKKDEKLKAFIPEGYEQNYISAYRRCQDKPGGATISGMPEARFEAYARAFAGCGSYTSTSYRRSYARMYEAVACNNHSTEKQYREHWLERPGDIVGRTIRLEPLDSKRHLKDFFAMTCGDIYRANKSYDPQEVWAFYEDGPFDSPEKMKESFVFQREMNEAGFAIIESLTGNMVGAVYLTNDNPKNLSISLELPLVKPSSEGTVESIEACFLLLDRLFALGYRRVQLSVDSMDTKGKKLSGRLGFTQEGLIPKDRIIKESNRDSIIYGMLNSDWDKGARAFLFKKLHGEKAMKVDVKNEKSEAELEKQSTFIEGQKETDEPKE
ncbi:hypothetical protein CTEN210_10955 [Chaetoceros tenuissimus]|uniref:N-acetyltransferase domain-containing protein n=1 Tax=Chaetoceros tenuissimus TaxID=426638 RepID=A0AAD3D1N8_9STRA|nr:hypothetical protein CTEN210_10955 [Chaetoceros tenuissimus]